MQLLKNCRAEYRGVILFSPYKTPKDLIGIDDELKAFFGCDRAHIHGLDPSEAMKEVAIHSTHQDVTVVVGMEVTTMVPNMELYVSSCLIILFLTTSRIFIAFLKIPATPRA
jgi:hypothetical protein